MLSIYRQAIAQSRVLVTTNYVISELLPLLASRRDFARQEIIAFMKSLRLSPYVEILHIDPSLDDETWQMAEKYIDKEWSWVDMSSFVVMRRLGLTEALTTDHHFTQAGFTRLPESS
jgi:predicted nucleic acid-binding protein